MNKLEALEKAKSGSELRSAAEKLSPDLAGQAEKRAEAERIISVEIEKKIIERYAPLLMIKGRSKLEAQTEWIALHAEKYRSIFNSEKDKIISMYKEDSDKAIDYIERQLE